MVRIQKAGGVQCLINLAYRGDFLSWVINLPRSRFLVVDAGHLDRLEAVADDLLLLEHATVLRWSRPDPPRVAHELLEALMDAPDHEPGVEVAWTDDARIMFTSGTTGRPRGRSSSTPPTTSPAHLHRGLRAHGGGHGLLRPPLFHSNAQVLAAYPAMIAGARIASPSATRRPPSGARSAADATILNTVSAINYFIWNTPPGPPDRAHRVSRIMAMPGPEGHLRALRGALPASASSRATGSRRSAWSPTTRPARRRDREPRRRDARVRGAGRARHRPAPAARHAG